MFSSLALRSLCLVLVVALAGCDLTGDYQLRIDQAATTAPQKAGGGAAGAAGLHADATPVNAPDGKLLLTIKLPAFFTPADSQWVVAGGKDKNGKDVTVDRANPPGVPLPGWAAAYEVFVDDGAGKKLPVYVYFGGTALAGDPASAEADLHKQMAPSLSKLAPNWNGTWQGEAEGAATLWTGTSLTADMPFDGSQAGGADVTTAGRCDFFSTVTGTHVVLVGWRCPVACSGKINFDAVVKAAMANAVMPSPRPGAPVAPVAPAAPGVPPPGPAAPAGS